MMPSLTKRALALALPLCLVLAACSKKNEDVIAVSAPPPPASAKPVAAKAARFTVDGSGKISVLIDAPLEKFKGHAKGLAGVIDVNPMDLEASTGEISADLDTFESHTFGDNKDKNETQTEHAQNWFELGEKVEKKVHDDYKMARFILDKVESASVKNLADAKEEGGVRKVHFKLAGQLRVHGRTAKKTVEIDVGFKGPPDAPTELSIVTTAPIVASLVEHDVKPRDEVGKFLAGTLETIGKKLDDKAQISVEAKAVRGAPAAMMSGPAPSASAVPSVSGSAVPSASASAGKS